MADIYQLGACTVKKDGAFCIPQASLQLPLDESGDTFEVSNLGEGPIACALGVTALPAPPADNLAAEGVVIENIGGLTGCCVAAWDTRASDVAGELSPGDTCLHGTHPDATKRARFFAKENLAAVIVGNDLVLSLDRGNEVVTLTAFGNVLEITPDSVKITQGGVDGSPSAFIQIKDGTIYLAGNVIMGAGAGAIPIKLSTDAPSATVAATA